MVYVFYEAGAGEAARFSATFLAREAFLPFLAAPALFFVPVLFAFFALLRFFVSIFFLPPVFFAPFFFVAFFVDFLAFLAFFFPFFLDAAASVLLIRNDPLVWTSFPLACNFRMTVRRVDVQFLCKSFLWCVSMYALIAARLAPFTGFPTALIASLISSA